MLLLPLRAADYLSFIQSAITGAMAASPPVASLLLVGALCAALTATSLWMQSVELQLPITFYRARQVVVSGCLNPSGNARSHSVDRPLPLPAFCCLQERADHPLRRLLGTGLQQERGLRPGLKAPLLGLPVAAQGGNQQYFPMRLSPSGARSLLFANFWAALLQRPFRQEPCERAGASSWSSSMCDGMLPTSLACNAVATQCGVLQLAGAA